MQKQLESQRICQEKFAQEIEKVRQEADELRQKDMNMIEILNEQIKQMEFDKEIPLKTVADRENKIKNLMANNLDLQA